MRWLLRKVSPVYARWLTRRFLDGVYVDNLDSLRELVAREPVILAANHVCWWDGQILQVVNRALGVSGKFIVNQESIVRLPYLESVGGLGIDRRSTVATLDSLERAAEWLDRPGRMLWMFPQGRFRPHYVRPLGLRRGIQVLGRLAKVRVIPVALSYHPLNQHLSGCVVSFGKPLEPTRDLVEDLEREITELLDAQTAWYDDLSRPEKDVLVPSGLVAFEARLGSRVYMFVGEKFDSLRRAMNGWLSGRRDI